MDEEKKDTTQQEELPIEPAPEAEETVESEAPPAESPEPEAPDPLLKAQEELKKEHENFLRLAAEYDNFRKRSQKEKDSLFRDGKAHAVEKFLPVYDNLSRALEQETADTAYKKGVEMTMTGLLEILNKLEVEVYGQPGDMFDPELHNAVMHIEDDQYEEGEIVQVLQKGFSMGGKVIRHAMVQTAN